MHFANPQDDSVRRPPPSPPPVRLTGGALDDSLDSQGDSGEGPRTAEESRRLGFFLELFLTPTTLGLTSGIGPLMAGVGCLAIVVGLVGFLAGSIGLVLSQGQTIFVTAPLFCTKWIFDLKVTWSHRPFPLHIGEHERTQKIAILVYFALAVALLAGDGGIFVHEYREKSRMENERRLAAKREADRLALEKNERERALKVEAAKKQEEEWERELARAQEAKRLKDEKEQREREEKREWEKMQRIAAQELKERRERDQIDRERYEADLETLRKEKEELLQKAASLEADFKKGLTQIKKVAPAMEAVVRARMINTKTKYDEAQSRIQEISEQTKRLKDKIDEIKNRQ